MIFGTENISAVKVEESAVSKIYAGSEMVWQSGHPTFSFELVDSIGGNIHGQAQGIAYDSVEQMLYSAGTLSSEIHIKKVSLNGTLIENLINPGGVSSLTIQDPCWENGVLYVPRSNSGGVQGYLQRFDSDLNYLGQTAFPAETTYETTVSFKHGFWWVSGNNSGELWQLDSNLSFVAAHDIATGNTYETSPHYSGSAWYGRYFFGVEHTLGGHVDVWYWDDTTLTLIQEIETGELDLYNGIAIHEATDTLYSSSRSLADDIQIYNLIIN
jgi:hypothetical protein